MPSSRFGVVEIAGSPAAPGTPIAARFGGTVIAGSETFVEGTDGAYRLDVPGDRPDTAVVEGPTAGQGFEVLVGGAAVATVTWTEGTYTRLDLSAAAGADLRIALDDGASTATAGAVSSFTLTVTNDGDGAASGIAISAELPAGSTFVTASDGGSFTAGKITWPLATLAEAQSLERTFSYRLAERFAAGIATVATTVRVAHDGSNGIDADPADNTAIDANTLDAAPDLGVSLDDGRSVVEPGATLVYRLAVANTGSQDAQNVVLSFDVPPGASFFSASHGGTEDLGRVDFPSFDLAAGASLERTLTLRVPADLDAVIISLSARARVLDDGENGADLDPADNLAEDLDSVSHAPDLAVAIVDPSLAITDPQTLALSGAVAITVRNLGTLPSEPVQLVVFEDRNQSAGFERAIDLLLGEVEVAGLAPATSAVEIVPVAGTVAFRNHLLFAKIDAEDSLSELDETNNLAKTGAGCASTPTAAFAPTVELSWPIAGQSIYKPFSVDSLSTPIVVQLTDDNGDGKWDAGDVADIVFVTANLVPAIPAQPDVVLRAIHGGTGQPIFNVDGLFTTPPSFFSLSGLAAGDIDDDGKPEIIVSVVSLAGQNYLIAYEHTGTRKWTSAGYLTHPNASGFSNRDNPTLADLDGDGFAEIIVGANVFNRNGQKLWRGTGGQAYQTQKNNFQVGGAISAVADVDLDGRQEVVTGNTLYRHDGTIVWQLSMTDGYPAVGNFDEDPEAEIVVVAQGQIRLHDTDGTLIWGPHTLPGSDPEAGGAPTIGDFDRDGQPEIGVAGSDVFVVYETDGAIRWQASTRDYSSNQTGSTIFDLDGDGAVEAIYRDERQLRIYRGDDGEVLYSLTLSSTTMTEMPVVADVDGDGNAEIIVTSDGAYEYPVPAGGRTVGLRVIGDAGDGWVAARPMWNQHAYHVDNVEDDAGLPRQPAWSWLTHNSFRANLPPEGRAFASPDLSASAIEVNLTALPMLRVSARIGNGGATSVAAGLEVAFYGGIPAPETLLGVATVGSPLAPGVFVDLAIEIPDQTGLTGQLWVVVDDDGTGSGRERECDELNNRHALTYGTDVLGLWLTKNDGRATVSAGSTVTYTIMVHNAFSGLASGVVVTDTLPPHTSFLGASAGGVLSGGEVSWGPLSVPGGGLTAVSLTLRVEEDVPIGVTSLTNLATVTYDGGLGPDLTPANNTASDTDGVLSVSARIGGPYAGEEGSPISFDGSASIDRDGTLVEWAWDLDGDGQFDDGLGPVVSRSFGDEGSHVVRLRVTDDSGEFDVDETTVTVANVPPAVSAPAGLAGAEGSGLHADGFVVGDPGTDSLSATISWGDGQSETVAVTDGAVAALHVYEEDGSYPIELCASDGDSPPVCASTSATIENLPPDVARATPLAFTDWTRQESGSTTTRWRVSADGLSVTQDLNGSPAFLLGGEPSYGIFELSMRVTDAHDDDFIGFALGLSAGELGTAGADFLLLDWKHRDQAGARRGLALSRVLGNASNGEFWAHHDEGANGAQNAVVELLRGATLGSRGWSRGVEHFFRVESSPGRLKVFIDGRLEIDYAGAVPAGGFALYDHSQAGVTYKGKLAEAAIADFEGSTVSARVRFSDPGVLDTHTATIDWGDGSALTTGQVVEETGSGSIAGSHTYVDDGELTVEFCAQDDEDASDCDLVPAVITNAPPVLTLSLNTTGFVENAVTLTGSTFSDAGRVDTHTATVDWGDGTTDVSTPTTTNGSGTLSGSHLYSVPGTYLVSVCVEDDDGGEVCEERSIILVPWRLDLQLQKTAAATIVRAGSNATFTLTVRNLGTVAAPGVVLVDSLPAQLSFVASGTSAGHSYNATARTVTWNLGTVAAGATLTRTLVATVQSGLPINTPIENRAAAIDNGTAGPDANPANNSASLTLLAWDTLTPIVAIPTAPAGFEGTVMSLSGVTWGDTATGTRTATIDWGDGSANTTLSLSTAANGTIPAQTHLYREDGVYPIEVCVTDSTGRSGCRATAATIANRPPEISDPGSVNLGLWRSEDYPDTTGNVPSSWRVAADGLSVFQENNSYPSIFHSPFPSFGLRLTGVMRHETAGVSFNDDDFMGFALGFEPGDTIHPAADFLILDWKQANQTINYSCPGFSTNRTGRVGLALSRVTGIAIVEELFAHVDSACNGPNNKVTELARAATLGSTAWVDNRSYAFTFEYSATRLKIWVDGVLQFDVSGNFPEGRFGFYNHSQENIRYSGFLSADLPTSYEGDDFELAAPFGDFGWLDTHTATADWDDGTTTEVEAVAMSGAGFARGRHQFRDDGDYRIEACVTDDEGASACGSFPLLVLNRPPVLTAEPDAVTYPGVLQSFDLASFLDPGVFDSHTATVDWGDGTSEQASVLEDNGAGSVSAAHAYAAPGSYAALVCAEDDDGGSGCTSLEITVLASPPVVTASKTDRLIDHDGDALATPGDAIVYEIVVSNTGGGTATAVTLTDPIPSHTTLVAGSLLPEIAIVSTDPVVLRVDSLEPSASIRLLFAVTIDDPIAAGVREIVNRGVVTTAEGLTVLTDDPDLPGGADPTRTPIHPSPSLALTKTATLADRDGNGVGTAGDEIVWTLRATTGGDTAATGLVLRDAIGEHQSLVPGSTVAPAALQIVSIDPLTVVAEQVAVGETIELSFRTEIAADLPVEVEHVTNQASVASNEVDLQLSDDPATATLADPTRLPVYVLSRLSLAGARAAEGQDGTTPFPFTLSLDQPTRLPIAVEWSTLAGSATAGEDFLAASGTATIPIGGSEATIEIAVVGDTRVEPEESFQVVLGTVSGAEIEIGEAVATIENDDLEAPLTLDDAEVVEGDSGEVELVFRVRFAAPLAEPVSFDYATVAETASDETAGGLADFRGASGTLVLDVGLLETTLSIEVLGDLRLEGDETLRLELTNPQGVVFDDGVALGTIRDDELCAGPNLVKNGGFETRPTGTEIPSFTEVAGTDWLARRYATEPSAAEGIASVQAASVEVAELSQTVALAAFAERIDAGSQEFAFEARLRSSLEVPIDLARVIVEYLDATQASVLDVYDSGELAASFDWEAVSDRRSAPIGSRFARIRLVATRRSGPMNDVFFDAMALRPLGVATVSIGDVTVYEGLSAIFPVTLSCPLDQEVVLDFATSDRSALAGIDYTSSAGSLTIPAGENGGTIAVATLADSVDEPAETLAVELEAQTLGPAILLDPQGAGTILNDDFCRRSPGYWKNVRGSWPIHWLLIGGVEYDANQMAAFLGYGGSDASTRLARHLTAAQLNLARGSHPYVLPTVAAADALLAVHPPGSQPSGGAQTEADHLKHVLDVYNNTGCQVP